jgi:hypothetical protein
MVCQEYFPFLNIKGLAQKKLVAVVTPVPRLPLTAEEQISMRHLQYYLQKYDRYIIAPRGLSVDFPGFKVSHFPKSYFRTPKGYNLLMLSTDFYRRFIEYEFILIYQLDCLVFQRDLEAWCAKGWDYVGAPWFKDYRNDPAEGFWAVGNGGLSLRKVASSLAVLESRMIAEAPSLPRLEMPCHQTGPFEFLPFFSGSANRARQDLHRRGAKKSVRSLIRQQAKDPDIHEDEFWSHQAQTFLPEFRIATPQEAVGFSFEMAPRFCFRQNSERLPFGCHAWATYDKPFWEQYLISP